MLEVDKQFCIDEYRNIYNMSKKAMLDLSERYGKTKGVKTRENLLSRFFSWNASFIGSAIVLKGLDKSMNYDEDFDKVLDVCEKNMSS